MALKLVMVLALSAFAIGGKLSQELRTGKMPQTPRVREQPPYRFPPTGGFSEFSSFQFFPKASLPYVLSITSCHLISLLVVMIWSYIDFPINFEAIRSLVL